MTMTLDELTKAIQASPVVQLADVAPVLFGINHRYTQNQRAKTGGFPGLNPFRATKSNRAPYLVKSSEVKLLLENRK